MQKTNNNHCHVVAAHTTSVTVAGETIVHHVLTYGGEVLLCNDAASNELNDGLRRLAIPDS